MESHSFTFSSVHPVNNFSFYNSFLITIPVLYKSVLKSIIPRKIIIKLFVKYYYFIEQLRITLLG